MKDMAAMQPGMSFYGELPDSYNLIVNTESPVVKRIFEDAEANLLPKTKPMTDAIAENDTKLRELDKDAPQTERTRLEEAMTASRHEREAEVKAYASEKPLIKQVIDLALLANGLLRGAELSAFITRSVSLL